MSPLKTAVVVLNWNGWEDTLECLESLLRSEGLAGPVIVCDNDSHDGSVARIQEWAEGRVDVWVSPDNELRRFSHPPVPKPIRYATLDRTGAELGGTGAEGDAPLVIVRTGSNLGFAGGNNVGLRYALRREDINCVWILNNDTVVEPTAYRAMVEEMASDPAIGICGSTLLYYDDPEVVQALGGATYNPWLALPRHIGANAPRGEAIDADAVRLRMRYVAGASMLVSRQFLEAVGLLSEDYFLYFEELDWVLRAGNRFRLGYAPGSVVYHKEGRSAGTAGPNAKSGLSDYYFLRNRLRITRRYFPARQATVALAFAVAAWRRVRRRQWERLRMIVDLWRRG